jgi:hypoxanthine phosphoribosyltransferase
MSKLYPFFFRFGVSFNYTIPQEITQRICHFISKKYNNPDIEYFNENASCETIGISDEEARTNSVTLVKGLSIKLKEYGISDFSESIFFIDAKQAYSDKFYEPLFSRINELIKEEKIERQAYPIFYILLDSIEINDMVYNKLYAYQQNDNLLNFCLVFDKRGNCITYEDQKLKIHCDSMLSELVQNISTPHINEFRSKLIRKINHFKMTEENRHSLCQLYYYEINNNDHTTVYNLLLQKLIEINDSGFNLDYIVYFCPKHSWLPASITSLSDILKSENMREKISRYKTALNLWSDEKENVEFERFKNIIKSKDKSKLNVLFISDIINTGTTFKKVINNLSKIPKLNLYCLSLLATDHAIKTNEKKGKNEIVIADQKISYFHAVKQQYYLKTKNTGDCPLCKYGIVPRVDVTEKIDKNISVLEMWQMCSESGFKFEDFIPEWRKTDKQFIIPNSIKLFKKNSPLLAHKFEEKLKDANIYSREMIIIYPDERITMNKPAKDTPSGYFANCLSLYNSNYNYLGISREIINDAKSGKVDFNNTENYKNRDIIDTIRKIDGTIIVIDEVNISTGTFETIYDILKSCHKYPKCYFPIFNFNVTNTLKLNKKLEDNSLKILSLYEFDLL